MPSSRTSSSGSSSSSATVASSFAAAGFERPSRPTTGRSALRLRILSSCGVQSSKEDASARRGQNARHTHTTTHSSRVISAAGRTHLLLIGELKGGEGCILVDEDGAGKPRAVGHARQQRRRKAQRRATTERHAAATAAASRLDPPRSTGVAPSLLAVT